jgi:acyl carrier protein
MSEAEIYERLTQIFRTLFEDAAITLSPDTTARNINGWDSARMMSIILAVEEEFAFEMDSNEIDALQSVGDFVAVIAAHRP